MTADRDTTRIVRSWLRTDEHESADRVLETVLSRLDTTPQRLPLWPARRFASMNTYVKLAAAGLVVVLVAVVGYNLLPGRGGIGGQSTPSLGPTPSAAAVPSTPAATEPAIPAAGPLAVGRHALTLEGVRFTLALANAGWSSGEFGFNKGATLGPSDAWLAVWPQDADGIFSNPCGKVKAPPVGASAADMARAIAAVPGTELVTGPTAVTIGGKPAQYVAVRIPDTIACAPEQFFLWYDTSKPGSDRYASAAGSTIRVWIVEVNGKRVQLEGETYKGAGPEIGAELQAIINSITFG